MLEVSDIKWYAPDYPAAWRGQGGLPPGWGPPAESCDGDVYTTHPPPPRLRVVTVPADGRSLRGVILGDHLQGVWLHGQGGRDTPCRSDPLECFRCRCASIARLSGYLQVWMPMEYGAVLHIPSSACLRDARFFRQTAALRSWGFIARRQMHLSGRPVTLEVTDEGGWSGDPAGLPDPVDVREVLRRLWGAAA